MTDEMRQWCADEGIGSDPDDETVRFIDHHRAKGTPFADPVAGWRNWMRRADAWRNPAVPSRVGKSSSSIATVRSQVFAASAADALDMPALNGGPP